MAVLELQRKIYPGINFSDNNFQIGETERYELNIFLNDSQFLFSITEPMLKEIRHIQSFNFFQVNNTKELIESVRAIFESEDLLSQAFRTVNVSVYNDYSTLVPVDLFNPESANDYLFFNFERDEEPEALYDVMEEAGIVNVYGVDRFLKKVIEQKFKNPVITHSATSLVSYLINASKDKTETEVFVYVQPKILQFVCVQKGQLKLFNSYYYSTPEDFIYYILYACQHLNLDPEYVQLQLLGEIVKDSVLYELTFKYIRNVQFAKRPAEVKMDSAFKMPQHFYFNLFCVNV